MKSPGAAKNGSPPVVTAPKAANFPPRDQTLQILTRILADGQSLDDALEEWSDRLDARGRAWVWDVAQTIFRYRGGLDALIDQHALKKKPTGRTRKQLWIAAVQIVFHKEVSPEKIVHETVEWVKRDSGAASAGFVNAMLRRIAESRADWAKVLEGEFPEMIPAWWTTELARNFDAKWISAFARASLEQPATWFRVHPASNADGETEKLTAGPVAESFRWQGDVAALTQFARKQDHLVQDLASQILIAENIAAIREARGTSKAKKIRVLDRCAAPGGKSIGLAWSGNQVYAFDTHERRRISLTSALKEKAQNVAVLASETEFPADLEWIWVDAPCTASGIVRRHPEMKWLKQPKDLAALVAIQAELLKDSWERLPSGAFLTYTVCSLFPAEGPEAIGKQKLKEYVVREWTLAPNLEPATDGFYGALLRKP